MHGTCGLADAQTQQPIGAGICVLPLTGPATWSHSQIPIPSILLVASFWVEFSFEIGRGND